MKNKLREIFLDLSDNKLSQKEALEKIKAVKLSGQDKSIDTLYAAPSWEPAAITSIETEKSSFDHHHIILCIAPDWDIKELDKRVGNCRCLSLQASRQANIAERYSEAALFCFDHIQTMLRSKPRGKVHFQIVLSSTQEGMLFAGLSGLLKTAALENPQITGQVIFTDADISAEELAVRLQADATSPGDEVVKYENDSRSVLRLQEVHVQEETPGIAFKDQGVYLITGGLGGLGILFTKEILRQTTNTRVILTGRTELTESKASILKTLSPEANRVEYRQLDITSLEDVKSSIASIKSDYQQLNGILHTAGMISDNFILKKTSEEFSQVLAPKVTGTYNLDLASKDIDLDFLILFSSTSSWLGNLGQSDYASANGFMDRFAAYRNQLAEEKQRYGQTLSINWPLWEEGGMRIEEPIRKKMQQSTGIYPLQTSTGMEALHRSLGLQHSQTLVVEGDISKIRNTLFAIDRLPSVSDPKPSVGSGPPAAGMDSGILMEKTREYLRGQFSTVLKLPSHKIDSKAPLEEYGIDSILSMNLTSQLEKNFDTLPKTLFFEYQTIDELSEYFIQHYADKLSVLLGVPDQNVIQDRPLAVPAKTTPELSIRNRRRRRLGRQQQEAGNRERPNINNEPIAIIGISGRYPESENIGEYWQNLRDGKDCITEVPKERWDWRKYYTEDRTQSGHYSKWGGFIAGVDEFDPRFFNISPREASHIDPQERLFLQHTWMAVEDAGYTRSGLQLSEDQDLAGQVGVYAGVMYGEYQLFGAEGKQLPLMNSYASIANRVSYVFNLHGPSMTLDTMCSSSLTAIHVACQDLKLGRTRMAIAGGVNVSIHPNKYLYLSAGQFISGAGHCQSFGEGGDGYIPGEGVGVVLLKRLSEAERDGDHIYGVIKGSVLNHGGKTNGYSVPNPKAQASAIGRALSESKIDPRHISYIEAHGTGTRLGDPIEIAALDQAFKKYTGETGYCLLGSAKSNIGHCESAAGIAGLTKVLLQLQHREIVPSLHSEQLNPYIDFDKTPFRVNQTLRPWDRPVIDGRELPRIAGISSFGAGGSNAHLIIEEYERSAEVPGSTAAVVPDTTVIIPLSARTTEQLKQKATDLLDFIHTSQPDLTAMAYTLQAGREAMGERLGFLVNSIDELAEKLQAYIHKKDVEEWYEGQVKRNKDTLSLLSGDTDFQLTVDKWITQKKFSKLLELWVKGLELDWDKFYDDNKPNLISLPTYPFAKERYWWNDNIEDKELSLKHWKDKKAGVKEIHPMLHENTSNLGGQSYSTIFTGEESYLRRYHITTQKALPAVAYLEMARAAVEHALPVEKESGIVTLHRVVLGQPVIVEENKQVKLCLFAQDSEHIDFEVYSEGANEDLIHCQGHAIISERSAPDRLDIAQVKARPGNNQLLAEIQVPKISGSDLDGYMLHPDVLNRTLETAGSLVPGAEGVMPFPEVVEAVHIILPCKEKMLAWVRYTDTTRAGDDEVKLNIDLSDEQGNISVQLRGVSYLQAPVALPEPIPEQANSPSGFIPREIPVIPEPDVLSGDHQQISAQGPVKKPTDIVLPAPDTISSAEDSAPAGKIRMKLTDVTDHIYLKPGAALQPDFVSLYDYGHGIFSIRIANADLSKDVIWQILQALNTVRQIESVKVLLFRGGTTDFLKGDRQQYNNAVEQGLYQAISTFPYPVIAVMEGNTEGAGFLFGALCDFMICSEEATYSYTDPQVGLYPGAMEDRLFKERFGTASAYDFMYLSTKATGKELKEKGWSFPILPKDQIEQYLQELAFDLARKPQRSLRLLKQHLARHIVDLVNALVPVNPSTNEGEPDKAGQSITSPPKDTQSALHEENVLVVIREKIKNGVVWPELKGEASVAMTSIALKSKVITATVYPQDILVVKMEDREAKNMFSDALTQGIIEIFEHIRQTPAYKVVILTGFENYFASGGTKEDLLAIQEGRARFTDTKFYHLAMECEVPVIAAMQGHAIGAGWSYGMFADFILFSEESRYLSPYMNFGFTPGAGATFILPKKIGLDLARETLLAAWGISGSELKDRGLGLPVMPRQHVFPAAMALAKQLVKNTREQLVAAKSQLTQPMHDQVEETYQLELAMHEETFVGQPETLAQIQKYFEQGNGTALQNSRPVSNSEQSHATPDNTGDIADKATLPELTARLKEYLAQELHLQEEEIDETEEFIDLGLDSITGVTWVRKINEKYKLSIEATKIYSYPTLIRFAGFVKDELAKQNPSFERPEAGKPVDADNRSESYQINDAGPVPTDSSEETDVLFAVRAELSKLLAEELHLQEDEIDEDTEFIDLGLDSITGVTWIRKINEKYKLAIEATKVYSYPTLNDFSKFVKAEIEKHGTVVAEFANTTREKPSADIPVPPPKKSALTSIASTPPAIKKLTSWREQSSLRIVSGSSANSQVQPIAIVGMAGQFPQAKNVEEFWDNITRGENCISKVPKARWDLDTYFSKGEPVPGKTNCEWMGALEEYDLFDPLFFNISPTEAEYMDPQQRLFLQACWHSIENAGYDAKSLSGSNCGVFAGAGMGDYQFLSRELQVSAKGFTGIEKSILAARISYFLNLQGPCLTIDTACSSSLVAIATACDSLISGNSDLALAGGVCVMATSDMHIKSTQSGMLSPDGRCYTFDNRANGFVPGEGVGVVVLKRLADAQKDQDRILGVIEGWGVNQDGKTNGITAPNPESQKRLMQDVYNKFRINPADIQLVEAHGTGTRLGDPIEVAALVESFSKYTSEKSYCAIGSVKSNIGHCMAAAGIAGVIKATMALKNKKLPPTINFTQLNDHINLKDTPFYVNDRLQNWNGPGKHHAAVSSFGFSGTNAHLVISEYVSRTTPEKPVTQTPEVIIPLSARNTERLMQRAVDLLDHVRKHPSIDLYDMAYTLQIGREAMDDRLAFIVSSVGQLVDKLRACIDGKKGIDGVFQSQVNRSKEGMQFINQDTEVRETLMNKWFRNNMISSISKAWVKGLDLDWNRLYGRVKPQRIELPVYPFAKERYWVEYEAPGSQVPDSETLAMVHPLLHRNTSNFSQQSYSSTFNGEEFFLKDHRVQLTDDGSMPQKVLPGVAYLEMAGAAIEDAMSFDPGSGMVELQNVVWVRPVVVSERKEISIVLSAVDDRQIDFEIYSLNEDQKIVHCQGQAILKNQKSSAQIDIEPLVKEMDRGQLDGDGTYETLLKMGLHYGPAHQGIRTIYQGERQALAQLQLPEVAGKHQDRFVLHPGLMDSAVQAAVGFTEDPDQPSGKPSLPFALERLCMHSPCKETMYSWVRYSPGDQADAKLSKLDIDLLDQDGNICVQMQGLTLRIPDNEIKKYRQNMTNDITMNGTKDKGSSFNETFYETVIERILNNEVSIDEAINLER